MLDREYIKEIIEREIQGTSLFLVDVVIKPGNNIVIEIDNDSGVSIDECVSLSKKIESSLDREVEDFELEVGSTGLTTPFKVPRQYKKNIGKEVEVLSKDGRKLSGVLKSCDDEGFVVVTQKKEKQEGKKKPVLVEKEEVFLYGDVKYAKYQISIK